MKILYLDQYFSTRRGISGTRSYEFGRMLVQRGHQVTVITSATRYAGERQRKFFEKRVVDGMTVLSVRIGYASQMGYVRRALSFALFMLAATCIGLAMARRDVVLATSTPLTIGVPGYLISRIRGGRFVFEVRDLWPEAPIQLGVIRTPFVVAALRWLERFLYRSAERIIALSPGMTDGVVAAGIPRDRVVTVPNACDLDLAEGVSPPDMQWEQMGLSQKFVVLYAGAHGPANGLGYFLDLAQAAREQGLDALQFLSMGEGPSRPALEADARNRGLDNLTFVDPVPREEVAGWIQKAGATVTLFADLPVLATNSPNKLFDSLAVGRPSFVNSNGWTRALVEDNGAGAFLPPDDPAAAARAIAELAASPGRCAELGRAARHLAETRLSRSVLFEPFERCLLDAAAPSSPLGAAGRAIKRMIDFAGSLSLVALLSPILIGIALAIRSETQGPVFYRQWRSGRYGRTFRVWKFRTMVTGADRIGLKHNIEEGDPRITRVGAFLREWSPR